MRRIVAFGVILAACGAGQPGALRRVTVRSPAFARGGAIPSLYTCDGRDISPPLRWSGVPDDATQLALTMEDPDAPGGPFTHWQLTGVSPRLSGLAAGQEPAIGNEGTNSFGSTGYRGPCPPRDGRVHHYVITITALGGAGALASGTLTGTYARR